MSKIVAAMNVTVDGCCDHTAGIPDADLHRHYSEMIRSSGAMLYGRKTFDLMRYWQSLLKEPSGVASMDEFAVDMDRIPKIVFSRTLRSVDWHSAELADRGLEEMVLALKGKRGKDVLVGSPGLIDQLTKLALIDEFRICIHPVLFGHGIRLFNDLREPVKLELFDSKTFSSGTICQYYRPLYSKAEKSQNGK